MVMMQPSEYPLCRWPDPLLVRHVLLPEGDYVIIIHRFPKDNAPVRAPGPARIGAFAQLRAARCAAAGSDEAVQACEAEDQVQTYEAEDQVCRAVIRQCKPVKRRIRSAGRPDLQGGHPPCPLHPPPRASAERRPPDPGAGRVGRGAGGR